MRISPNDGRRQAATATGDFLHRQPPLKELSMILNRFSLLFSSLIATLLAVFALNAFAAIDANQATRADLETVKGIGPGLSAKIVEARKTGSFKNWDDLVDRVGGIGPRNATRLSEAGLTVGGATFEGKATAKAGTAAKADKSGKPHRSDKQAKSDQG
jgi:competence protein ComEA